MATGLLWSAPAQASLGVRYQFVGHIGVSTDGLGSSSQTGTISANVPLGATVLQAYLYSSTFSLNLNAPPSPPPFTPGGTLAGSPVAYGPAVINPGICPPVCTVASNRADVTSIIAPLINGGPGGVYNFTVTEAGGENPAIGGQDGEALVVVYQLASLPIATVGILDGFSAVGGDTTTITFASPLDPTAPGFFAEMRLGIGFSCCSQTSTVRVNGTTITTNAGNNDDADVFPAFANGNLITVGSFNDPFSPFLPTYAADKERYNLIPQITLGSTSIVVNTNNPSSDDNIFLAAFWVSAEGVINQPPVPEPTTWSLVALGAVFALRRRFGVRT